MAAQTSNGGAKGKQLKTFSRQDITQHNKEGDLWIVVDTSVYDLSNFVDLHPGGAHVLLDPQVAGKDATEAFFGLHRSEVLKKYQRYLIGHIEGEKPKLIIPKDGEFSLVPHAEPIWLSKGYKSPYYNASPPPLSGGFPHVFWDSHRALAVALRKFTDENLREEAREFEDSGERPSPELIQLMGKENINAMRLGPGKHLHGLTLPGGMKGEDFDYFHELVMTQELVRVMARGYSDGMQGGMVIGLPPVMNFGSDELKKAIIPDVLAGKKFICLAISEAFAGSDVAGMKTTATKTPDGKHYIVNGHKKWITNGHWADYFSTGVRTDKGLSMLLIPRGEGVETKLIKSSYSSSAGTAYVTFDNVKVPVENLLGKENKGLQVILSNFNHERWVMCCGVARGIRSIIEESFKWSHQRKVFGKPLISQPVIRQKFAGMFAKVESLQSFLETVTFNMCNMNYFQQADLLAGHIGLLKMYATRIAHETADEAVQIFGGRGITKSGMGKFVEGFQRTYKFDAVLGGSEEILGDLGVRQAMRKMPPAVL